MKTLICACLPFLFLAAQLRAQADDAELKPLQGKWEVIELVENGHSIPHDAIKEWLPSGGRIEIVENSMNFVSHEDGKKHAKVFEIDNTQIPKGLDLLTREKKEAVGIYKFDDGKLIVCLSDPEDGPRPDEFSAKKDSKRMLMVLKKLATQNAKDQPEPTPAARKGPTDEELGKMLRGTWRYRDEYGTLSLTLQDNGRWSTIRESQEMRLLQKVFVRTPVSSGTWSVKKGTLYLLCTSSIHPDRVNHSFPFTIRSVTDRDFVFVDYSDRAGKATKAY